MKTFKAFCAATVLALSLSNHAYSNDIQDPGKPTPGNCPVTESVGTESNKSEAVNNDIAFSALVDALWALASML